MGTVNSEVVNNTIYLPNRWAIRILQETNEPGFLQCGDNAFRNNIVVVGNAAAAPTLNIGPNTRPETFLFSNNLWYNIDNPSWTGPNLPATELNGIIGRDPMLAAPPSDMHLNDGSPAIMAGYPAARPLLDYLGVPFSTVRSIGAIEGRIATTSVEREHGAGRTLRIVAGTGKDDAFAMLDLSAGGKVEMELYDMHGKRIWSAEEIHPAGTGRINIPLGEIPSGAYICVVRYNGRSEAAPIIVRR